MSARTTGSAELDALAHAAREANHDAEPVHDAPVPLLNLWLGDGTERMPTVTVADMGGFLCWGEAWGSTVPTTMPAPEALAVILQAVGK